jgi:hypothetical protein
VLDALIPLANAHFPGERSILTDDDVKAANEAIAIVKQMMQAEPVLEVVRMPDHWGGLYFRDDGGSYISEGAIRKLPIGTKLYTHPEPQAVPAGWVSLEDGMPSPHQMVLVARESHVTTGSYTPAFGWAWEEVDGEDEDSIATHWMELPSPPKGSV